jgi:DUF3102 family protein
MSSNNGSNKSVSNVERQRNKAVERRRLAALPDEINEEITMAERNWREAVTHAINAGEKLIEAKGLLKHGQWSPWLDEHFPGSEKTASNYMRLARHQQRVANLPTVRDALAALSAPKEAPPVQQEEEQEKKTAPEQFRDAALKAGIPRERVSEWIRREALRRSYRLASLVVQALRARDGRDPAIAAILDQGDEAVAEMIAKGEDAMAAGRAAWDEMAAQRSAA